MRGKVKWFDEKKGFGFIAPDGGGKDCFVHYSSIKSEGYKTLAEGDTVTFDLDTKKGQDRPAAANVQRV